MGSSIKFNGSFSALLLVLLHVCPQSHVSSFLHSNESVRRLKTCYACYAGSNTKTANNNDIIGTFLHSTLEENTPFTITLQGLKQKERGSIRRITARSPVQLKKHQRNVTQITFCYYGATDIVKNWAVGKETYDQLHALLMRNNKEGDSSFATSIPASEWNAITTGRIESAILQASDWQISLDLSKQTPVLRRQKKKARTTALLSTFQHDRVKPRLLNVTDPLWSALGLTKGNKNQSTAQLKPGMKSKFRQCEKFVEIVSRLIPPPHDLVRKEGSSSISVVDMGCGRGYLTFALHSYLMRTYNRKPGSSVLVSSLGIDVRPKLVKEISGIATQLDMHGLTFETGTIESYHPSPKNGSTAHYFHMLMALHACDTATDDALWAGIEQNADLIIVAPCCHKEIRSQLDRHHRRHAHQHPYGDVLCHGIYRERMAETVTDALRALLLEYAGYSSVQVFEFIGGEHTAKNVMITALKGKGTPTKKKGILMERIQALASFHGIQHQKLAARMSIDLSNNDEVEVGSHLELRNGMPPLGR